MIKDLITSTAGVEESSTVIRYDLSDQSCVDTPLGQLFMDKAGLSRGRVEYNKVFLQVYDCFIHVEMLDHFGLDSDDAQTLAHDADYGLWIEDVGLDWDSMKDCKRGLELYVMCDTYKRKAVREAGYDRSGYFSAHKKLDDDADHVEETLNKRINELHRQRIKAKKAKKQATTSKENLAAAANSWRGAAEYDT